MPHSIFFMKDGHAIHGSHEVKNLGKPASHGCVRVSPANAAILYDLVKENGMKNTQVVLAGTTPGGEAKVAAQPAYPRYADAGPWPGPGQGYYPPPRRGFFGRWFQPDNGPQGYYRPRGIIPEAISPAADRGGEIVHIGVGAEAPLIGKRVVEHAPGVGEVRLSGIPWRWSRLAIHRLT